MKSWTNEDVDNLIKLNNDGLTNNEICKILCRTPKSIRVKSNRIGLKSKKEIYKEEITCKCCGNNFIALKSENRMYCSQSCAAKINDVKYPKRVGCFKIKINKKEPEIIKCLCCGVELKNTKGKYCDSNCQQLHYRNQIFEKIENGDITLSKNQYKKYLIYTYGNKCMECGWDKKNIVTGNIPIELEHIDGNSENNNLENLKLLCPNCHSLTPTYKALNIGNGRHSRRQRYKDGKSY